MFDYTYTREDWVDPSEPVSGPDFPGWADMDFLVIHYPGRPNVADGDEGETVEDVAQEYRDTHHFYLNDPNRGYSMGYNVGVDQWGNSWELRGETYRNAANRGRKYRQENPEYPNVNHRSISLQVKVDGESSASPAAEKEIQRFVRYARQQNPNITVVGHRDVEWTACPGNGIYWQLENGKFEPEDSVVVSRLIFQNERLLDTRGLGGKTSVDGQVIAIAAPVGAAGVKVNVTAVNADGPGYITVYSDDHLPDTSSLNYMGGSQAIANQVDVAVQGGVFKLFVSSPVHVVVDLVGFFLP
jgi:hypothetical protein